MGGDTAPIRDEERFDEARVAAHLAAVIPEIGAAPHIEFGQFRGGHANLTYLVRAGDTEYVLRRPPLGEVAPGSHDMAREHRVLSVLYQEFPLAPRAVHYCADPGVMGKPFFVMERRRGTVIRGAWPAEVPDDDATRRHVGLGLIDALAALHGVDVAALGLSDLGRPDGFARRQVTGWSDRWERSKTDDVPDMERLRVALGARVPEPRRASLLHNDFKLDNTMVDGEGTLVAVFDWDMATTGDPLVDLGTTLSYFDGPDEVAVVVPPDRIVLGGVLDTDDLVARYQEATGLDCSDLSWYRALASFRIAVILQQIYVRYARGQTSDERFAALGSVVPVLAAAGLGHIG